MAGFDDSRIARRPESAYHSETMRVFQNCALFFLLACGISFGQVPPDWEQWVADGLTAEEDSNYKEAARLLGQACDVSIAADLGSERLTQGCSALVGALLTDRKSSEAIKAAERLTVALSTLPEARQVDRVLSSILVAHGYAYVGDFQQTNNALKTAVELTKGLELIDGVLAYTEIATFYLPTGGKAFGDQLLTAAIQTLGRHPTKAGENYIDAVKKLALVLDDFVDRSEELVTLLTPVVEQAQEKSKSETEFNDLWRDRTTISQILEATLETSGGESEAKRREQLRQGWPQAAEPEPDGKAPSDRIKRAQPMYPTVAQFLKIRGTVSLSVEVGSDGRVRDVRVERPVPYGLTSEAIRAVRQWIYAPMLKPVRTQINVVFQPR